MMAGLYLHIPFCKSRCIYCGFFSTTCLGERSRYVGALCREMELRAAELASDKLQTVYLGGGTPSLLDEEQLEQLLAHLYNIYNVSPSAELTVECNPDDVSSHYAAMLARQGVNRVSMGAQTFSPARLLLLRRRHTPLQVALAVDNLRQAGIGNISLDLIYGFPGQTMAEWEADIDAALALRPTHLSAYALSYEEGTPLTRMLQEGRMAETDEELLRRMYYTLKERLEGEGFEHYEISNFALPGHVSRHNSSYWTHTPYMGLGAAAHSLVVRPDGRLIRRWNVASLDGYLQAIEAGRLPAEGELLTPGMLYDERVMLRLRTRKGLPLSLLTDEQRRYCLRQAAKYVACGWLLHDGDNLRLAPQGLFVSDAIFADLLWEE